ncbi:MAG: hypothetical protein LIO90_00605 [Bacteroidales bacterium]|nr:hypothetical protein [Bacteroidales bacterium]
MKRILLLGIILCWMATIKAQEINKMETPSFDLLLPEGFIKGGESPWCKESYAGKEYERKFWLFTKSKTREAFWVDHLHPEDNVFDMDAVKQWVGKFEAAASNEYTPPIWNVIEEGNRWRVTYTKREPRGENGVMKSILRFYVIYVYRKGADCILLSVPNLVDTRSSEEIMEYSDKINNGFKLK